jgi:hypothetical protein
VVHTFIHHQILPLRVRVHPLWQHQGIVDPMMEFPYPISEEILSVLMISAVGVDYPGEGIGPTPFSTDHPPPVGQLLTRMVSEPPLPPYVVE